MTLTTFTAAAFTTAALGLSFGSREALLGFVGIFLLAALIRSLLR